MAVNTRWKGCQYTRRMDTNLPFHDLEMTTCEGHLQVIYKSN